MDAVRTKLGNGGRVIIPAIFRRALHLEAGSDIILHIDNDVISITTPDQSLQKLQSMIKDQNNASKKNTSLVEELISMRRAEADNE